MERFCLKKPTQTKQPSPKSLRHAVFETQGLPKLNKLALASESFLPSQGLRQQTCAVLKAFQLKFYHLRGWGEGSVAKGAYCCYRGPKLGSQHSHKVAHGHLQSGPRRLDTLLWPLQVLTYTYFKEEKGRKKNLFA